MLQLALALIDAILRGGQEDSAISNAENSELKVKLFTNNVDPDWRGDTEQFVEPVGGWYSEKELPTSSTLDYSRDPVTGEWRLGFPDPTGGPVWTLNGDLETPEVIHGYFLTSNNDDTLFGWHKFATPISLENVHDSVEIPQIKFYLPQRLTA